jgi:hypothetical protein
MKSYIQAVAATRAKTQEVLKKYFADTLVNVDVRWADFELAVNTGVYSKPCSDPIDSVILLSEGLRARVDLDNINSVTKFIDYVQRIESVADVLALKREILSFGYTSFR